MLKMGFFGKKKSRQSESSKDISGTASPEKSRSAQTATASYPRRHAGHGKSVRFASGKSSD